MCGEGFGLYSEMERQREMQEERVRDCLGSHTFQQVLDGLMQELIQLPQGLNHPSPSLRSHFQSGPCRVGAWQGAVNTGTGQLGTRCCYLPLPESASPWQRGFYQILLRAHPPSLQALSRHCRGQGHSYFYPGC